MDLKSVLIGRSKRSRKINLILFVILLVVIVICLIVETQIGFLYQVTHKQPIHFKGIEINVPNGWFHMVVEKGEELHIQNFGHNDSITIDFSGRIEKRYFHNLRTAKDCEIIGINSASAFRLFKEADEDERFIDYTFVPKHGMAIFHFAENKLDNAKVFEMIKSIKFTGSYKRKVVEENIFKKMKDKCIDLSKKKISQSDK